MNMKPHTDKELTYMLAGPHGHAKPFGWFDPRRVPWGKACSMEPPGYRMRWQEALTRFFIPACQQHKEEVLHDVMKKLFGKCFPQLKYQREHGLVASFMVYWFLRKRIGDMGNTDDAQEHNQRIYKRWKRFPFGNVALNLRDIHRFQDLGVLPGEPDPKPQEGDYLVAKKKKKKTSKKVSKKTSTKASKKKKKTSTKPAVEKDTTFGDWTSKTAEGDVYDKRLGRPGTARRSFCEVLMGAKGGTADQCIERAVKDGVYTKNAEGREKAANQFKMNVADFKRRGDEMGLKLLVLDEDKKKYRLEVKDANKVAA